jgi:hypothetical protein
VIKILLITVAAALSSNVAVGAEEKSKPADIAQKATYGISESNPIKIGSPTGRSPAKVLYAYMDRLQGPKGEKVTYRRVGTCCEFKTPRGLFEGVGILEVWEATYDGLLNPTKLFINVYDYGDVSPPTGFLLKD